MGAPAGVEGDRIQGTCTIHLMPGPMGGPTKGPPMPFSAPLKQGLATTVLIGGKPAAVVGSLGQNTPPHPGLHPSDPCMVPKTQMGSVLMGSTSVTFEGKAAAKMGSTCKVCTGVPSGTLAATASTVLIGG